MSEPYCTKWLVYLTIQQNNKCLNITLHVTLQSHKVFLSTGTLLFCITFFRQITTTTTTTKLVLV